MKQSFEFIPDAHRARIRVSVQGSTPLYLRDASTPEQVAAWVTRALRREVNLEVRPGTVERARVTRIVVELEAK